MQHQIVEINFDNYWFATCNIESKFDMATILKNYHDIDIFQYITALAVISSNNSKIIAAWSISFIS